MAQLDQHMGRIAAHRQQLNEAELSVRSYGQDIARAEGDLPREEANMRQALDQAGANIAKLEEYARKEAGQRGDIDRQVDDQAGEIEKASRDLVKQAREGHDNFAKWGRATHAGVNNATEAYERSLDLWWRDTRIGLIEGVLAGYRNITFSVFKASNAMQRALMGMPAGKYRAPAYMQFGAVGGPPGQEDIVRERKKTSEIGEKFGKFRNQLEEQQRKITDAHERLSARRDDAHAKIDAALKERSQQLTQWHDRREQLKDALTKLAERKGQLDTAKKEMAERQEAIAQRRQMLDQAARGGGPRRDPPTPTRN